MPPGSPPTGGFRKFAKHCARGVKNVFRPEAQMPTFQAPLQSQSQSQPSSGDPSLQPDLTPTRDQLLEPLVQSQQSALPPRPVSSAGAGGSTSTPDLIATNDTHPANAESTLAKAAKKAGADAWAGLKTTLRLVEKSSDVFPPLKSAVGGFLGVIDIFETASQNRKDYEALALNLQSMLDACREHPGEHTSSRMSEALKAMASGLEKEIEHVFEQRHRPGFKRHLEAGQDVGDVQECHRRMEIFCRELQHKALVELSNNQQEQKAEARLKELNPALKAMYDSSMSTVIGRRKCTPGTRKTILAGMREWADDPDSPKVYWLNGMAGTGKTTLAYSFCDEMQAAGRLGASFFCSRADADSQDVSRIVATVAYQLARLVPSYREALNQRIGEDKDIGAREIRIQFEKLIRDPLLKVKASIPEGIVVTIDALDECDRRDGAQDILNVLLLNASNLPIKFFVTCRPEPGLFDMLQSESKDQRSELHLHDVESSFVQADIKTYLEDELGALSLPQEKLEQLAERAGALFIYAATAVRYIRPKGRGVNFGQRLDQLLSITSKTKTNKHKGIDDLYTAVLAAPFADEDLDPGEKKNIRLVLDTALCAREPMSVATMAKLLDFDEEEDVIHALQHLRSVLHVSQGANLISTLHASFPDFMLDHERSKDLCCNAAKHHQHLSLCCFSTMQRLLRFNICELESSFVLDENIPDLAQKIENAILPVLYYACRYWGDHWVSATDPGDLLSALKAFLSRQLLFWMEVLNLKSCISAGASTLAQVYAWLRKLGESNSVLELALDASRFVTAFGMSSASRSTPHIYISALSFWLETSPVRQQYWKHTRGLISLKGPAMERRDLSCLATWNTASGVCCVTFSPSGTRIVSGSSDNTIHVWDARSGALVAGSFEGHTKMVNSVGFSPDGTRIVSGSYDTTICVWDARSGALVAGPIEGHTSAVMSVGFSPDGTRIVSGSSDNTIHVWDACSGDLVTGPLEGHTSSVMSVGFSPDGTRIVSGSCDNTICVWDARSGALVAGPFEGHTSAVNSVGFSPDGTRIVSGSYDKTIRVWDARSGALVAGPFEGHTSYVLSVGFSPDGTRIASGSWDKTIRVWDAHSGALVAGPFEGHTLSVRSVGFSPDGTRIVSGSHDETICVWDARSGGPVAGSFEGHASDVRSVGFSPNGTRIVSGSDDGTTRVWDSRSGALMAGPFEGHTDYVSSVGFSPDGTRIVSGSFDHTIRVWDARSGALVAGPFKGHISHVSSVGFSPDGTRIVSGSWDKTIRVWDARSGALVAGPFEGHTNYVHSVGFSPDGTRIASGSHDGTIRVWNACSGALVARPFEGHTERVMSVGFSPDGTHVVSSSFDKTIRVWDASSGALVAGPLKGHTSYVVSVGFSPDGTRIVSGSYDSTIRVWDARSGTLQVGPFVGHTRSVNSVAFSPDGSCVVSGSDDHAVRVWDVASLSPNDSQAYTNWLMGENGMVVTHQKQLLLCVPLDLRTGLISPRSTVCIYRKGALELDFNGVLLGSDWVGCYQSH